MNSGGATSSPAWTSTVRDVFDRPRTWALVVLLLAMIVMLAGNTGNRLTRDPVLYGAVARQMAEGGDLVVPRFGDEIYLTKPPLMFWASAALMRLFGPVGFAARFPSALLGVFSILLTYRLARRLTDRETALLSAIILVTFYTFLRSARTLRLDTIITATTLGALLVYLEGADRLRFPRWGGLAFFGLVGLGVLGKGYAGFLPLGLALIGAPRKKALLSPWFWGGAVLPVVLVGGWLLLVHQRLGADWTLALGADVKEYGGGEGRLAMFLKKIPLGFVRKNIPWSPLVVLGTALAVRDIVRGANRGRAWLLISWILIVCAAVFNKQYQFTRYLVPVCPALAILAAVPLRGWFGRRSFTPFVAALAAGLFVAVLALLILPIRLSGEPHRLTSGVPAYERLAAPGDRLPFVGELTRGRTAVLIYYYGRIPDETTFEEVRGTGRVVLIEEDAVDSLPAGARIDVLFPGKGYSLARVE